jgi:chromosomal replication initiation ATPase DnaA
MTQLAIDLPHRPAFGRADFLVSECNAAALQWIERWPDWPSIVQARLALSPSGEAELRREGRALVLYGPAGSGKSHLASLWRERGGGALIAGEELSRAAPNELAGHRAVALDDAERAPERALLHLYNCVIEAGASLLVVAREAPASWPIALPDLASRLRAAPAVAIAAPDDTLLAAVLVKHFADRQVRVAPGVIGFLLRRMERTFAAAGALAGRLDRLALGAGRPITVALARRVLAEAGGPP